MTESVSVTRSPIELFWTAKNIKKKEHNISLAKLVCNILTTYCYKQTNAEPASKDCPVSFLEILTSSVLKPCGSCLLDKTSQESERSQLESDF